DARSQGASTPGHNPGCSLHRGTLFSASRSLPELSAFLSSVLLLFHLSFVLCSLSIQLIQEHIQLLPDPALPSSAVEKSAVSPHVPLLFTPGDHKPDTEGEILRLHSGKRMLLHSHHFHIF